MDLKWKERCEAESSYVLSRSVLPNQVPLNRFKHPLASLSLSLGLSGHDEAPCRWIYSNADQFRRMTLIDTAAPALLPLFFPSFVIRVTMLLCGRLRRGGAEQWPWCTIREFVYKCRSVVFRGYPPMKPVHERISRGELPGQVHSYYLPPACTRVVQRSSTASFERLKRETTKKVNRTMAWKNRESIL